MKKNDIIIIRNGSIARFIKFTENDGGKVAQILVKEDRFGNSVYFETLIYKNAIVEVVC